MAKVIALFALISGLTSLMTDAFIAHGVQKILGL